MQSCIVEHMPYQYGQYLRLELAEMCLLCALSLLMGNPNGTYGMDNQVCYDVRRYIKDL